MELRPSLLHQLAIAAAVKTQLGLEASMAERRARETALVPAGSCGPLVTTALGDHEDTAESSTEALREAVAYAAALGPVAQVNITATHLCFGSLRLLYQACKQSLGWTLCVAVMQAGFCNVTLARRGFRNSCCDLSGSRTYGRLLIFKPRPGQRSLSAVQFHIAHTPTLSFLLVLDECPRA